MSWASGILGVWQWGKQGIVETYDYHLRPACPKCTVTGIDTVNTVRQGVPVVSDGSMAVGVSSITRLAGLSGAAAIGLGAYGAHVLAAGKEGVTEEQKKAFDVANRYHMVHSVALLGVPLVKRPRMTGGLMVGGMVLFCGTTYYHALTGDKQYRRFTPYGGILLIIAWLSMVL
eukprot:GFUD01010111.1.p1 GENE.GFUD01010111.1~~GFUD01010111.1.p1  ORF type:complete len:173 (-),score=30.18 GFUD01010111.1:80-598(-)